MKRNSILNPDKIKMDKVELKKITAMFKEINDNSSMMFFLGNMKEDGNFEVKGAMFGGSYEIILLMKYMKDNMKKELLDKSGIKYDDLVPKLLEEAKEKQDVMYR